MGFSALHTTCSTKSTLRHEIYSKSSCRYYRLKSTTFPKMFRPNTPKLAQASLQTQCTGVFTHKSHIEKYGCLYHARGLKVNSQTELQQARVVLKSFTFFGYNECSSISDCLLCLSCRAGEGEEK